MQRAVKGVCSAFCVLLMQWSKEYSALALVSLLTILVGRADSARGAQRLAACSEIGSWLLESPALSPSPRMRHMMAFDGIRRITVIFGGLTSLSPQVYTDETWTWDGYIWQQQSPTTSPTPRNLAGFAYDEVRGNTVLFGGARFSSVYNDTWTWDGINWSQEFPATTPGGKFHVTMAYDAVRDKTVMFGGHTNTTFGDPTNETWTWDGNNWTLEMPASSPSRRGSNGLAFDQLRGEIVLFGGEDGDGLDLNDTWVWDGSNWLQKFPATSPPAGYGSNMVWSDALGTVVLIGGVSDGANELNQSWLWDGMNWTEECGDAPQSGGPTWSAAAYDPIRAQVILFGGRATDGLTPLDGTQSWPYCDATPCMSVQGDLNCDGVHTVVDVVKMVNVTFRNADPATEFCQPCP